jgi:hypothetical protein
MISLIEALHYRSLRYVRQTLSRFQRPRPLERSIDSSFSKAAGPSAWPLSRCCTGRWSWAANPESERHGPKRCVPSGKALRPAVIQRKISHGVQSSKDALCPLVNRLPARFFMVTLARSAPASGACTRELPSSCAGLCESGPAASAAPWPPHTPPRSSRPVSVRNAALSNGQPKGWRLPPIPNRPGRGRGFPLNVAAEIRRQPWLLGPQAVVLLIATLEAAAHGMGGGEGGHPLLLKWLLFAAHHITARGFAEDHAPGPGGVHEGEFASHGS